MEHGMGSLLADITAIAAGGAVGSLLRHAITRGAFLGGFHAAWGTLLANLVGSFAIGVLAGYVLVGGELSPRMQIGIRVGLLGGLTTFSTFVFDFYSLMNNQRPGIAVTYLCANVGLGIACVVAGAAYGKTLVDATA